MDEPQPAVDKPQPVVDVPVRRSQREHRSAIPDDYIVYLQEHDFDLGVDDDPRNYGQAVQSSQSSKWMDAMVDELRSMDANQRDSKGNVERHKARLVAKGFSQKESIDYTETFSPISSKDAFRIVMALVAHFDLELHQMDVKTAFLNGDLTEDVFMEQPEGFQVSGSNFIFLILYVDDILLASNNLGLLYDTKNFLSRSFAMTDLGEASFVLGIEIYRDRSRGMLGLSQKAYISKVLERFNMSTCSPGAAPIMKEDKFSKLQNPQNELERSQMKDVPYSSAVGSLMYAQVCTCPDITFAISVLGKFQSSPGVHHWTAAKKVMRYLQRTKDFMLTYRRSGLLEVVGYADADFTSCSDDLKSTSGFVFMLAGGAISWKSVKQTLQLHLLCKLSLWHVMRQLFKQSGCGISFQGSKHIEIKYLVIREKVQKLQTAIVHIAIEDMIADPLTKGLSPKVFQGHVTRMGLVDSFDVFG
ncbi:hypothetical protein Q3G72_009867 [Acer saccharum]|nr:hypothetical protein Q3G72_009867 [Acer saccharum]